MGRPIDGGPPVLPTALRDLNGHPVNPVARAYPAEFIETGISAIDGLHTLVRGQKLPVFSGYGLPGLELATRIAHTARVPGSEDGFVVVFAAIGVTDREAAFVRTRFTEGAALERSVVFVNRADEPAAERLVCPRAALTAAEYLAFELDLHVLVVLVDMTTTARRFARPPPPATRFPAGAATRATCTPTWRRCSNVQAGSTAAVAR
jgi:V/A-type H+-transporting ATPase subunit B